MVSIDGYLILPNTISSYLVSELQQEKPSVEAPEFDAAEASVRARIERIMGIDGTQTVDHFHRELGAVMWKECAMSRNREGLENAIAQIKTIQEGFWREVKVTGKADGVNPELEKALRLIDFLELSLLMCTDALQREESCGAHFREEYQTEDREALRVDDGFSYVSAWEYQSGDFQLHREELNFEYVQPSVRSYQ